jgi:hypothetical protein
MRRLNFLSGYKKILIFVISNTFNIRIMKKILILSAFGLFGALATVNAQSAVPAKVASEKETVATEVASDVAAPAAVETKSAKKSCCSSKASASKKSGCGSASADMAHVHTKSADGKACCAKAEARLNEDGTEDADAPSVR